MTEAHFEETIDALMSILPFKPFTIELTTGQRLEIDGPGMLLWKDSAVFKLPGGPLVIFDHEGVSQIINSPAHSVPGKRRHK